MAAAPQALDEVILFDTDEGLRRYLQHKQIQHFRAAQDKTLPKANRDAHERKASVYEACLRYIEKSWFGFASSEGSKLVEDLRHWACGGGARSTGAGMEIIRLLHQIHLQRLSDYIVPFEGERARLIQLCLKYPDPAIEAKITLLVLAFNRYLWGHNKAKTNLREISNSILLTEYGIDDGTSTWVEVYQCDSGGRGTISEEAHQRILTKRLTDRLEHFVQTRHAYDPRLTAEAPLTAELRREAAIKAERAAAAEEIGRQWAAEAHRLCEAGCDAIAAEKARREAVAVEESVAATVRREGKLVLTLSAVGPGADAGAPTSSAMGRYS